jgi:hypothetical protein
MRSSSVCNKKVVAAVIQITSLVAFGIRAIGLHWRRASEFEAV